VKLPFQKFLLLAAIPISVGLISTVGVDMPAGVGLQKNKIMLFRATPYEVRPGDIISLDGSGFSKTDNRVLFNGGSDVLATSTDGVSLKVVVPSISEGQYSLSLTNKLGSSLRTEFPVTIRVTNNPSPAPIITSATLSGDMITVVGSGFTASNNVISTFGNSSGSISSSGNSLTFSLSGLSLYQKIKEATKGKKYQSSILIYIYNEHGMSKDPYKLDLVI
jgi:hypothetical protein